MKIQLSPLAAPTAWLYRLWFASLRRSQHNFGLLVERNHQKKPNVLAVWHDELFPVLGLRITGKLQMAAIVSQSKDGEYLAEVMARLGYHLARGSSSRGGVRALLQAGRIMRNEGFSTCLTVDGPRGPRHEVKDGIFFLAHAADAPIIPIRTIMTRRKVFGKAWDKFQLPLPFSRVHTIFGEPYYLESPELTPECLAFERERLKNKLNDLVPDSDRNAIVKKPFFLPVLRALAAGFRTFGFSGIRRSGRALGGMLWLVLPSRRRLAIKNLQEGLELEPAEAQRLARESFKQNGQSFLELFLVPKFSLLTTDVQLKVAPADIKIFKEHPGPIVAATAHMGAWELLAGLVSDVGRPAMVVVRHGKNATMNAFLEETRGSRGTRIVAHRNAARTVLRYLNNNGVAAFLVDHNTQRQEAIFLPFLGKTAAVNVGPAVLAVRAHALIVPVFLVREGVGYCLKVSSPLDTTTLSGDHQHKIEAAAEFYTKAVENMVRAHPEQWFWMHNRWKTQPAEKEHAK